MEFTEQQIADFFAELKRQAAANGNSKRLDGVFWRPLEAIAGARAYRVFSVLRDRGLAREEVLPGCFGHAVHHLQGC